MSIILFGLILSALIALLFLALRGRSGRATVTDTVRLKITGTNLRALQTVLDSGDPHLLAFRKLHVQGDPRLISCLPPDWENRLQKSLTELTHRQIEYSINLRLDEVHAALKYVRTNIVLTGSELPSAIIRDVSAGAIAFRVACHNLVAWLRTSEPAAREYYSTSLSTIRQCSAGDLLAMHARATSITSLYDRTLELKAYLSRGSTPSLSAASAIFSGNIATLMQFLVIYLPGEDVVSAWQNVTKTEPIYKYSWFSYGREIIGYNWLVHDRTGYCDLNDICRSLVARRCTETDVFSDFAKLIGGNPFHLIWRLSMSVDEPLTHADWTPVLSQLVSDRQTVTNPTFGEFQVLLARQYWLLHDRLAKWIIRCIIGAPKRPELNVFLMALFAEVVSSQRRISEDEFYWGAQHFILCCTEQLLSHLKLDPDVLTSAMQVQSMQELLLAGHRLVMSNRGSDKFPEDGTPRSRFLARYERFSSKHAQESHLKALVRLQETYIGGFHPGPPKYLSTWPQAGTGNSHTRRTRSSPASWRRCPFILDHFDWGDPYDGLRPVLQSRGWIEIGEQTYRYEMDETTITLDLLEKTFFVEPDGNADAAEGELFWISFAAYAAALKQKYGGSPSTDAILGRMTFETVVGRTQIRAVFDGAGRSWAVDPMQIMTQWEPQQ